MSDGMDKRKKALEEDYFQKQNRALLEKLQKSKTPSTEEEAKEVQATPPPEKPKVDAEKKA